MEEKSYQNKAESLLKEYILADPFIPYTSIVVGIFACKLVYDLAQLISVAHFKSYSSFSRIQRVEWRNRAISTVHAMFITVMSLYFVFWSDLFSDNQLAGLITFRSSFLSTFTLGVSVGYFLTDLGIIIWFYPSLGGMEYVLHHLLLIAGITYSMLTGEGQLYTYMVLISETTTPGINLRWYLDTAGMKRSRAYVINGVVTFVAWLVATILLFVYLFYHVYLHYNQVKQLSTSGQLLVIVVPIILSVMSRRSSMSGNMAISSEIISDDLHMRLNYLENRVACARLLFSAEAILAMEIADADMTSFLSGLSASKSKGSSGNLKDVDLNETPSVQAKRLQLRLQALLKTVETGRRYFPNCSEVLDKILDYDLPDASFLEKGTPEDQKMKMKRFMELKDDVQKAFFKDKAENNLSGLSSSSSSSGLV